MHESESGRSISRQVLIVKQSLPYQELAGYLSKRGRVNAHTTSRPSTEQKSDLVLIHEDALQQLEDCQFETPKMVVGSDTSGEEAIKHFSAGAADYYSDDLNNFRLIEAKILAITRNKEHNSFTVGNVTLDMDRYELWVGGEIHRVVLKDYRVLEKLMKKAGYPVSFEEIIRDTTSKKKAPPANAEAALRSSINRLKMALYDPISQESPISRVVNFGYKYNKTSR